ncbi:hypothetical protein JXA34_02415, partial [Patescibacteria group bacterium]|nr:hypothetical protein [Patescibacteria group bacterium]
MTKKVLRSFCGSFIAAMALTAALLWFLASKATPTYAAPALSPGTTVTYTEIISYHFGGSRVYDWNPGELGVVVWTIPEDGIIRITGGWYYSGELTLNGDLYDTYTVTGQTARQLSPLTKTVLAGNVWTWRPGPNEPFGSQLGVWFDYIPLEPVYNPVTHTRSITYGSDFREENWLSREDAVLEWVFDGRGRITISDGWVFTGPLKLNGANYPLTDTGELAPHLVYTSTLVEKGEVWTWRPGPNEPFGSQLGV